MYLKTPKRNKQTALSNACVEGMLAFLDEYVLSRNQWQRTMVVLSCSCSSFCLSRGTIWSTNTHLSFESLLLGLWVNLVCWVLFLSAQPSLPARRSTLESRRVPSRSLKMAQHAKLPEFDCHWGMGNRTDSSKLFRPPLAYYGICDTHTHITHHTQHMSTNNNMIYFKTAKRNFAKEIKQAFPY